MGGGRKQTQARCNLQAKKIPAYISTDCCQPVMTTSLDKTTIKSGSNRAANINPLEDCSSRHAGAQKPQSISVLDLTLNVYLCVCMLML